MLHFQPFTVQIIPAGGGINYFSFFHEKRANYGPTNNAKKRAAMMAAPGLVVWVAVGRLFPVVANEIYALGDFRHRVVPVVLIFD